MQRRGLGGERAVLASSLSKTLIEGEAKPRGDGGREEPARLETVR